jgi:hypothetical protein
MCAGIASPDSSPDARAVLTSVPTEARDHQTCLDAIAQIAAEDDTILPWLGTKAEPGVLGALSKNPIMPCTRIHLVWARAVAERPQAEHHGLVVAMGTAIKRCPKTMDGVVANALSKGVALGLVVEALDPYAGETTELTAMCTSLKTAPLAGSSALVREHASDVNMHACHKTQ